MDAPSRQPECRRAARLRVAPELRIVYWCCNTLIRRFAVPRPLAIEILEAIVTHYQARRAHDGHRDRDRDRDRDRVAGLIRGQAKSARSTCSRSTSCTFRARSTSRSRRANRQASKRPGSDEGIAAVSIEQDGSRLFIGCAEESLDEDVTIVVTVDRLRSVQLSGLGDVRSTASRAIPSNARVADRATCRSNRWKPARRKSPSPDRAMFRSTGCAGTGPKSRYWDRAICRSRRSKRRPSSLQ